MTLIVADLLVIGSSYLGVAWPIETMPLLFGPLFPIFFVAMMTAISRAEAAGRRRLRFRDIFVGVPLPVIIACALGFYGGWVVGVMNISSLGQPQSSGGRYYLVVFKWSDVLSFLPGAAVHRRAVADRLRRWLMSGGAHMSG